MRVLGIMVLVVATLSMTIGWAGTNVARAGQISSAEQQIVVTGIVPERRMIVVDEHERIVLITSNTPNAVPPKVVLMSANGPTVPFQDGVRRQYEGLISQLKGDGAATITPAKRPLDELFPDFVTTKAPPIYEVVPARTGSDPSVRPYWIASRTE